MLVKRNVRYRLINILESACCVYLLKTGAYLSTACNWFDEIALEGGAYIDDAPIRNFRLYSTTDGSFIAGSNQAR